MKRSLKTTLGLLSLFCISLITISKSYGQSKIGLLVEQSNINSRYIMNYTEKQPTSALSGYGMGIFIDKAVTSGLSVKPSVKYRESGFRIDRESIGSKQMLMNINSYSLDFSLLAKISLGAGLLRPYFELGPALSYIIRQDSAPYGKSSSETIHINELRHTDKKFIAGIGFETTIARSDVEFYFRYEMGLTNQYTGSNNGTVMRNNGFSFGLSFSLFSIGEALLTNCVERKCSL